MQYWFKYRIRLVCSMLRNVVCGIDAQCWYAEVVSGRYLVGMCLMFVRLLYLVRWYPAQPPPCSLAPLSGIAVRADGRVERVWD